jgi:hypothetical protein
LNWRRPKRLSQLAKGGYIRLVRALERHRLMWVEIDSFDPRALALIRRSIGTALNKQLAAFRDGTGKDVEFLLDLNFNFKTEASPARCASTKCPSIVQYPHRSSPIQPHTAIAPILVQPIANVESTNRLRVSLRPVSWNRSSSRPRP